MAFLELLILPPLFSVLFITIQGIYRVFLHPLRKIPGPLITKCSSLWLHYHAFIGDQCTAVHQLHEVYGPIVRVGPNDVDISKSDALGPIYIDRGGFEKSAYYTKFDIDGHATIFSTMSSDRRAPRAKSVLPIFSTASIKEAAGAITRCAQQMVERMGVVAKNGKPVNILTLTRAFALDSVTAYVFQQNYGGIHEKSSELSASLAIDGFVAVGRLYYVSHTVFDYIVAFFDLVAPDLETRRSLEAVDVFVRSLVKGTVTGGSNYPSRLLTNGMAVDETIAQCKDVLFAGSDSTGTILAMTCWFLVANPEKYARLRDEIVQNAMTSISDLQMLPYLNGVVREALRLSMSVSNRLPRIVPPGGWNYDGYDFPAGANVGVAAFELHLDRSVFPEPGHFLPERWIEPTSEMNASWLPFGKGARSCIARNLAFKELLIATERIVAADVLKGAKTVKDKIDIYEWFNSKTKGGKIELLWPKQRSHS
ncbi:MAG: hypothetical protein M1819_000266 [Sarea resinae]|nr:MAG: hypothetical protein M1819_000266 [Sarea resinae]